MVHFCVCGAFFFAASVQLLNQLNWQFDVHVFLFASFLSPESHCKMSTEISWTFQASDLKNLLIFDHISASQK